VTRRNTQNEKRRDAGHPIYYKRATGGYGSGGKKSQDLGKEGVRTSRNPRSREKWRKVRGKAHVEVLQGTDHKSRTWGGRA